MTKDEDEEEGERLRAGAGLSGVPPPPSDAAAPLLPVLMWRTRTGLLLMACNFEGAAFEVMHELDSFPASS